MLFFSTQKLFSTLIFIASFFNPYSGIGGLCATVIAIVCAYALGFSREQIKTGLYTYSALLLGLAMGTFYELNTAFWILLFLASIISVLLAAVLIDKLGKRGLPALSLAFVFTLWIVILASSQFTAIGITQRNIYWLNEMYQAGGSSLVSFTQQIENIPLPDVMAGFFHSLGAVVFQNTIAAGILLTAGLLFYSRIALLLMVFGYATALVFIKLMGGDAGSMNYYNLGTNFMLVSLALGGFYIIPSLRSFLWILITVPISFLLIAGIGKITNTWGLPVFALPFCFTVILFLYCLQLRTAKGKLVLTPVQYFSPEENLYRYSNGRERWMNNVYHHLQLPVMGEWMVSQGYNGSVTHKGDWGKALDFVLLDDEMKTYRPPATLP